MDRRTIQLQIAGQSYKVVSTAGEGELQRLAATVSDKVLELVPPGRSPQPQAVLLAAMALAHELESERAKREELERRARDVLRRVLVRIDDALEARPPLAIESITEVSDVNSAEAPAEDHA